jgi:hypothetical protein
MRSALVTALVVAVVVGAVLLLPVMVGGTGRPATRAAADTAIPLGAFGGLGLTAVVSVHLALTRRGRGPRDRR